MAVVLKTGGTTFPLAHSVESGESLSTGLLRAFMCYHRKHRFFSSLSRRSRRQKVVHLKNLSIMNVTAAVAYFMMSVTFLSLTIKLIVFWNGVISISPD